MEGTTSELLDLMKNSCHKFSVTLRSQLSSSTRALRIQLIRPALLSERSFQGRSDTLGETPRKLPDLPFGVSPVVLKTPSTETADVAGRTALLLFTSIHTICQQGQS